MEPAEQSISALEFVLLVALLCLPSMCIAVAAACIVLRKQGLLSERRLLAIGLIVAIAPSTIALALLIWLAFPDLATDVLSPSSVSRYVFLPGIASASIVVSLLTGLVRWVVRLR